MREHRVSYRYARALLESAQKEGEEKRILEELLAVKKILEQSRELRLLAASPVVQLWRKRKAFEQIFEQFKLSKLTLEFVLFLIDKRRGNIIIDIIEEYHRLYLISKNILPVEIFSAVELSDKVKKKVEKKVEEASKMDVLPKFVVDPALKGGIVVKIDDWVFDASIKNRLNELYKTLAESEI